MRIVPTLALTVIAATACGDDGRPTDTGTAPDASPADTSTPDTSSDAAPTDTGTTTDAAPSDTGTGGDGGGTICTNDDQCTVGVEWCEGGRCVPCDNSGAVCDLACADGTGFYFRNGCSPCDCAPTNDCVDDAGCLSGETCYAGAKCWDWCPAGDPSCCLGNICSAAGCTGEPPAGCSTRGCPAGKLCSTTSGACAPSRCDCTDGSWSCTEDCGGGVCVDL